jgi:acylphosphatase
MPRRKQQVMTALQRTRFLFLVFLVFIVFSPSLAKADNASHVAIEGWVSGDVQKVGFRAFIFNQAIRYNLGGMIENQEDGKVHFILQGSSGRLSKALTNIRRGPGKANITDIQLLPTSFQEGFKSVTVKGWTSESRDFHRPVDLEYPLRSRNGVLSENESRRIFKEIVDQAMNPAKDPGQILRKEAPASF